jgi:hypothetical protein
MAKDDLEELRAVVRAGTQRGAEAHIRLAEALIRAGLGDEAKAVLDDAIASRVSDSGSELSCVSQESAMWELRYQITHPRPADLPQREWQWAATHGLYTRGRVDARNGSLHWLYLGEPPTQASHDQSFSAFAAQGPWHPDVPEDILGELVTMLDAAQEPWVAPYIERKRAKAYQHGPVVASPWPPRSYAREHLARLRSTMSTEEAERFEALRTAILADIRAGSEYALMNREDRSQCTFVDGRFEWADQYCDEPPRISVLEGDDDLIWTLLRGGTADAASAIRALEEAIRYTKPAM